MVTPPEQPPAQDLRNPGSSPVIPSKSVGFSKREDILKNLSKREEISDRLFYGILGLEDKTLPSSLPQKDENEDIVCFLNRFSQFVHDWNKGE
jgi:hypothetical protein